jgi:hypothetical protein
MQAEVREIVAAASPVVTVTQRVTDGWDVSITRPRD